MVVDVFITNIVLFSVFIMLVKLSDVNLDKWFDDFRISAKAYCLWAAITALSIPAFILYLVWSF